MTRSISKYTSSYEKIRRKHRKIARYLKRSGKELKKQRPDLDKIAKLKEKASMILIELTKTAPKEKEQKIKETPASTPRQEHHPKLTFELKKISECNVKKFGTYSCSYSSKVSGFNPNSKNLLKDMLNSLENVFSNAIDEVKTKCKLSNPEKNRMRVKIFRKQEKI